MAYTATDREQIDEIKKWWNDYGKAIAIAVVIGLAIGFGWRFWTRYQATKHEIASNLYQVMMQQSVAKNAKAVAEINYTLQQKYAGTVYATMGGFTAAHFYVANKKYSDAVAALSWIFQKSNSADFRQVARLRDVQVLLEMKRPKLAQNVINKVEDKRYQMMIDEMQGNIYAAEGKHKAAVSAWKKAKAGYTSASLQNPFITYRLES